MNTRGTPGGRHAPGSTRSGRPPAATVLVSHAAIGVVGSIAMIAEHSGLDLPFLGIGPTIPWITTLFGLVAAGYAAALVGALATLRPSAWFVALATNGLVVAVLAAVGHDWEYALLVHAGVGVLALTSPQGQDALLRRPRSRSRRPAVTAGGDERDPTAEQEQHAGDER